MKRILTLILASAMCIACLTACGGDSSSADSEETTTTTAKIEKHLSESEIISKAKAKALKDLDGLGGKLHKAEITGCYNYKHQDGSEFKHYVVEVVGVYPTEYKFKNEVYRQTFFINDDGSEESKTDEQIVNH